MYRGLSWLTVQPFAPPESGMHIVGVAGSLLHGARTPDSSRCSMLAHHDGAVTDSLGVESPDSTMVLEGWTLSNFILLSPMKLLLPMSGRSQCKMPPAPPPAQSKIFQCLEGYTL